MTSSSRSKYSKIEEIANQKRLCIHFVCFNTFCRAFDLLKCEKCLNIKVSKMCDD